MILFSHEEKIYKFIDFNTAKKIAKTLLGKTKCIIIIIICNKFTKSSSKSMC